ncbi:MAG: hypothetical protein IT348_06520 [Candidatus Eisenbacteria bacterium]|nr:hypothetical protein [Candidatus Eisenbacteria bacterium]
MNHPIRLFRPASMLVIALFFLCMAAVAFAVPVGTHFTYQGKLQKDAAPYSGAADMVFRLYDDPGAGNQIGADVTLAGVTLAEGLFTVELDFGGVFDGTALWLEVQVLTDGEAEYTTLAPRQLLAATPYALHALSAPGSGGGGSDWVNTGGDLTYSGGGIGVLNGSSPYASGKGVFIEGGGASGYLYAYDYDTNHNLPLLLNSPGGNVGIGTVVPVARLEVSTSRGLGLKTVSAGSLFEPINAGIRVHGATGTGLSGTSCVGVWATSTDDRAVAGFSTTSWGVSGDCTSAGTYGILGTPNEGIYGLSPNVAKPAGRFVCPTGGIAIDAGWGLVKVKTLQILGGADLAERFDVTGDAEPGTVLTIDPAQTGSLRTSDEAYSHRVAGVVSGANQLNAGVVLSADERTEGTAAVALTGRVWVKCDATESPIVAGDLLTTSARAGFAMKAVDRDRAQGAVLGKAMSALESGTGMVLVIVSLQ